MTKTNIFYYSIIVSSIFIMIFNDDILLYQEKSKEIDPTKVTEMSAKDRRKYAPKENWKDTEPGKFAHSLQYEDKLSKPIPYKFKEPEDSFFVKGKLTDEERKTESENYFEHLCNTEWGNYVWETVDNVDYIAVLRLQSLPIKSLYTDEEYFNSKEQLLKQHIFDHPKINKVIYGEEDYMMSIDALEDPLHFELFHAIGVDRELVKFKNKVGLGQIEGDKKSPYYGKYRFYSIFPSYSLSFNKIDLWFNNNIIVNYVKVDNLLTFEPSQQPHITARYGITWRGFERPRDREFGIAGGDLIIVDLQNNNKVIAVQRNFAKANINFNKNIYSWNFPLACPESYKNGYSKFPFNEKTPFKEKLKILNRTWNDDIFDTFVNYVLHPANLKHVTITTK